MIYIVDDDSGARESLCFLLEAEGLEVEAFASAEAFLEKCGAEDEGCLVVDLYMPGMSGLDLLETLRARGNRLAAVVVTGSPSLAAEARAGRARAALVEKPFCDRGLIEAIRRSACAGCC